MGMNKITYLHSGPQLITGVGTIFHGQWKHIQANLKDKRKTKNKRIFLSGVGIVLIQPCKEQLMIIQRIWLELELSVRQVGRPPSIGLPATSTDNLYSYTLLECGGLQRTDRAVTTCRLPPEPESRKCIHLLPCTRAPRLITQRLPTPLRDFDRTYRQAQDMGTPKGTMNRHLNLALLLLI